MKNLKIGLTVGIKSKDDSLWTNGIKLNVLILAKLLQQSPNNYDVYLLNNNKVEGKPHYLKDYKFFHFNDKFEEMDIIFLIGAQIEPHLLNQFRQIHPDKKIISYRCGNEYILLMEQILFKEDRAYHFERNIDETWYIPQHHETNGGFFETLHRTPAITVPFVWDKQFLLDGLVHIQQGFQKGDYKKGVLYEPKDQKVLATMEPNLNTVKFFLLPLMIAEEAYRTETGRQHIAKFMISNSEKVKANRQVMDILKSFDLYQDNKIRAESRYQTGYFVTQYVDVVICHQLNNPLNYLYLDVAYMEYPLLHNAPLCQDLGYYYPDGDTVEGARQLNRILKDHDANRAEYKARNNQVLRRYESTTPDLIATYDMLIDNLYKQGNSHLKDKYDWKTNGYTD